MRINKHAMAVSAAISAAVCAVLAAPLAAHAGTGSLQALTPLTIAPGGTVDFQFGFTRYQELTESIFSEAEPPPAPGTQIWLQSSTQSNMETLSGFSLELSTTNQSVGRAMALLFEGGPGSLYTFSDVASFSFAQPGTYTVSLSGSWASELSTGSTSFQGSRSCLDLGGGLVCTDWEVIGIGSSALQITSGSFAPISLQVQVVPEPQTFALLLAGLGLVAGVARRRRG